MRTFKISIMVTAMAIVCSQAMAATKSITLTCRIYNFNTNLPQTAFHPGDKVLVVVTCSFPTGAGGITSSSQITLSGNATATFPGFTFPFSLNPVIGKFQNKNPKDGTQLFLTGDQKMTVFKISGHMPIGSTVTVFLTASAPGLLSGHANALINVVGG